jgi:hypothetical protein
MNKNNLPYFRSLVASNDIIVYRFVSKKFSPCLRKYFPCHYLITQDLRKYFKFINQTSKKYPFFLKIDIKNYFPSINHQILLKEISNNYLSLTNKEPSRRFQKYLKNDIPKFLSNSPFPNQGLPLGNPLSYIFSGIYLLKLDLNLNVPFLRFCDDYLLFFKDRKEIEESLKNIIIPILNQLNLEINLSKLKSGRFNKDKCSFLGFEFIAGYKRISEKKIKEFKKRIIKITSLTRKKSTEQTLKLLNNQILGFGHYYKFADCNNVFKEIDSFIRFRFRRYVLKNKNLSSKTGNLFLNNQELKELGLKSLIDIKTKFDKKFPKKNKKTKKIKKKTGYSNNLSNQEELNRLSDRYREIQLLNKLDELTDLLKKLDKKITKIDKKWKQNKLL